MSGESEAFGVRRLCLGTPVARTPLPRCEETVVRALTDHWLLVVAVLAVVTGFILLKIGSLTIAPLLLVAGYCLLLPLYLWRSFRRGVGE